MNQVKFGDYITIQGTVVEKQPGQAAQVQNNSATGAQVNGYLSTSGFSSNELYLDQLPKALFEPDLPKGTPKKIEENIASIRNYRDFVFQIWPKLDYDAHKKYQKLTEEKRALEKRMFGSNTHNEQLQQHDNNAEDEDSNEQYLNEVKEKRRLAKIRMKAESESNMKQIDTVKGNEVCYGQEIFLMHADSKQFITGMVLSSESEKSAFMMQVSSFFQRGMVFKLLPRFKLRKEGEPMQYKDQIYLLNQKQGSWASFSPSIIAPLDKPIAGGAALSNYYKAPDFKKHLGRKRVEVFLSKQKDTTFQLHFHSEYIPQDDNCIRGGDLICLYHTELQGTLTATIPYKNTQGNAEAFIRRYEGEYTQERYSVASIWEVEVDSNEFRGQNVQVSDLQSAEKGTHQSYKLRHFLTGKVLSQATSTQKGKEVMGPCIVKDDTTHLDQQSRVQFVSTQGDGKEQMESNLCYLIKLNNQYIVANPQAEITSDKIERKNAGAAIVKDFKDITEDMIYKQIDDSEFEVNRQSLMCLERGGTEENAFQVIKLSESEKSDILQIHSSRAILFRFISQLRSVGSKDQVPKKELLKRVVQVLSDLIFFLVESDSNDALEVEGTPNVDRQRMMKDFRFIELLTDILYYPMKLEVYKISELDQIEQDVVKIFKLCNALITHSIREYRPNEIYASQWIDLLIYQSVMTEGDCDIGSEETLTELIDNNKKILERIDEQTVNKFLKMLYDEKEAKYVKLVSALVLCNGQAVPNQELISKLMLGNLEPNLDDPDGDTPLNELIPDNSSQLKQAGAGAQGIIYRVKMQQGEVWIQNPLEETHQYIKLKDFQTQCQESTENKEQFDFVTEMIILLSQLCKDKNYEAINPLSRVFKRNTCFEIIKNTQFLPALRRCFTQLVHSMYVDVSEISRFSLPNNIRAWTEINKASPIISIFDSVDKNSINLPQNKNVKYVQENLKGFVQSYLSDIAKLKYMNALKEEQNKLTVSILHLGELIVDCGFLDTKEQLQDLLRNLFKILNSTIDVTNQTEKEITKAILAILGDQSQKGNINQLLKRQKGITISRFSSRYELSKENSIIQEAKVLCCKIIKKIILIRNDMRVSEYIRIFKGEMDSPLPTLKGNRQKQSSNRKSISKPVDLELSNIRSKQISMLTPVEQHSKDPAGSIVAIEKLPLTNPKGTQNKVPEDIDYFTATLDEEILRRRKQPNSKTALSMINDIFALNAIKVRGCVKIDVVAILQDLSLYESPELVNISFEILNLLFTERQTMLEQLGSLQLLETEESIKTYFEIREIQSKLTEKVEKSENWLFKQSEKGKADGQLVEKLISGLVSLLGTKNSGNANNFIDQSEPEGEMIPMANVSKQQMDQQSKTLPGLLFDEQQLINTNNQQLIRNSYLYQQILSLLRYDAQTNTRSRGEQSMTQASFDTTSVDLHILQLSYKLLGRFVCHSPQNQQLILPVLQEFVYKHMRTLPTVYANYLLEPLIADNVFIVMNDDVCRKFVKEVFHCVKAVKQFSFSLAACYLDTLRHVPYLNDQVIKENQTLIVNELTNKNNSSLLLSINITDPSFAGTAKAINELQGNIEKTSSDLIEVPGEVDYFNSLIFLMATICDQKNNATESKAQSYLPLKTLSSLFEQFKNCFYVKRYLYFFFFHVYLDTEKEMSDDLVLVKKSIIEQIQQDFLTVTRSLDSQGFSLNSYRGKISVQQLKFDFIFESLLLCIDTILFKKLLDTDQKKPFYVAIFEGITILSRVPILKPLEKKKIKGILIQLVQKKFILIPSLKEHINNADLIPAKFETAIIQKNLYETSTSYKTLPRKVEANAERKDGIKGQLLDVDVKTLRAEPLYQEDIRNDFKSFVDYFTNIKNISQQAFKGICTIDFSELTSAMIHFMVENTDHSGEDENISNELSKKRLQVLRQIIELENPDESGPVDTWESIGEYGEEIKRRQDKLNQQGVIEMIVNTVKDANAPFDLKEEAILLGIALLFGGNTNSQEEFLTQLSKDSKNLFLGTLQETILKGISIIKKSMSKQNKLKQPNNINQGASDNVSEGDELQFNDKLSEDELQGAKSVNDEDTFEENSDAIPPNVFEEIQKVCRVYRLLQLFCEGHNISMQNHLRLQIINKQESGKSIDFVYTSSLTFANVIKFVNIHCVDLADQILDFLTEIIQGPCADNQVVMCRGKIIETCKDFQQRLQGSIETTKEFLLLGFDDLEKKKEIDSLVNKTFKLLYSLIEGDSSPDIMNMLYSILDFKFLFQVLTQRYNEFKQSHHIKSDNIDKLLKCIGNNFDEGLSEVFDIFLLISTLSDSKPDIKEMLDNPEPEEEAAIAFFKYNCASIEIVFKEKLIRVYFPIQPICRLLSKTTRMSLMEEIPRETPGEKIEGLVDASADLFDEMEHQATLKSQIFFFSAKRLAILSLFSYFLALVINMIILFSYKLSFTSFSMATNDVDPDIDQVTLILGIIQFVITIVMTIFWIAINAPLVIKKAWRQLTEANSKGAEINDEEVRVVEARLLPMLEALDVLRKTGPEADEFNKHSNRDFGHLFVAIYYYWKCFQFLMVNGNFMYMLFYTVVSAMGLFVSDIVYCLHLLDIIVRFPALQNVIKAVTTNIGQLGLTTLLGAVIIYIYTIFAFYFSDITFNISDAYAADGSSDIENTCTTLFQCYLFTVNKGLVNGGGIGEGVKRPSYTDDKSTFAFRYIFDLSFFMIVNIAFLNFIFGIIIDTFAQLRDEKQQKEEDKRDVCFICGLSRDQFDQVPGGFYIHIENEHQLWYYVYYIYYLKKKDSTEYNGIESYISDLIAQNETSWFPSLRALSIGSEGSQDQNLLIEGSFSKMKQNIKEINAKFDKLSFKSSSSASSSAFNAGSQQAAKLPPGK